MSTIGTELKKAIRKRIGLMINRFLLEVVDDTGLDAKGSESHQRVDGTMFAAEGLHRAASHFQNYGFTAVPLQGAEGLALQIGGSRSRLAVINIDDPRHRPTDLAAGEVQIYTDEGLVLHAKQGRIIFMRGVELDLDVSGAALVKAGGEAKLEGATVVLAGTVTIDGTLWAAHTHAAGTITAPAGGSFPGGLCTGTSGGVS